MDIEFLVERLERYILQDSPKFFGNRLVNEEEVRSQLTQVRQAIPVQVQQARELVEQRDLVLEQAQREADRILVNSRNEALEQLSEQQLAKEARRQSAALLRKAEHEAELLRADADEYVFEALSQLQGELTRILRVVENGLQKLETDRERNLQREASRPATPPEGA